MGATQGPKAPFLSSGSRQKKESTMTSCKSLSLSLWIVFYKKNNGFRGIYLPIYPSTYLSICIYIYRYLSLSLSLCLYLHIDVYIYIFIHLFIYIFIYLFLNLFIYESVDAYIFPSIPPPPKQLRRSPEVYSPPAVTHPRSQGWLRGMVPRRYKTSRARSQYSSAMDSLPWERLRNGPELCKGQISVPQLKENPDSKGTKRSSSLRLHKFVWPIETNVAVDWMTWHWTWAISITRLGDIAKMLKHHVATNFSQQKWHLSKWTEWHVHLYKLVPHGQLSWLSWVINQETKVFCGTTFWLIYWCLAYSKCKYITRIMIVVIIN